MSNKGTNLLQNPKDIFAHRKICPNPFLVLEIGGTGKTAVCCHSRMNPGFEYVGDILKESLEDIWNGSRIQRLRRIMYDGDYDRACKDYCPQLVAFRNGNNPPWYIQNSTPELCEEIEQEHTMIESPFRAVSIASDGSCNLACIMCRRSKKLTSTEEEAAVSRKLYAEVARHIGHIHFLELTGNGDAFFNRDVLRFLTEIGKSSDLSHLTVRFITNAIALDESCWRLVRSLRLKELRISVSIDAATKATYESIRVGAKWETLVERMEMLAQKRREGELDYLQVTYVVMKRNINEMVRFVELAKQWNCDRIDFQRIFGDVAGRENIFDHEDHAALSRLSVVLEDPAFASPWVDVSSLAQYRGYLAPHRGLREKIRRLWR